MDCSPLFFAKCLSLSQTRRWIFPMPTEGVVSLFHHDLVVLVEIATMFCRIITTGHLNLRGSRSKTHNMSQLFINFYSESLLTSIGWSGWTLTESIVSHMSIILLWKGEKWLVMEAVYMVNFIWFERWDKWVLAGPYFIYIRRIEGSFRKWVIVLEQLVTVTALASSTLAPAITMALYWARSHLNSNWTTYTACVWGVVGISIFDVIWWAAGKFITQNKLTVPIDCRALSLLNEMLLGSLDKCLVLFFRCDGTTLLSWRFSSLSHVCHSRWTSAPWIEVTF